MKMVFVPIDKGVESWLFCIIGLFSRHDMQKVIEWRSSGMYFVCACPRLG